jgi:hypothetical protein
MLKTILGMIPYFAMWLKTQNKQWSWNGTNFSCTFEYAIKFVTYQMNMPEFPICITVV